jgi:hypothetical protein
MSRNCGTSNSHNSVGLHGLLPWDSFVFSFLRVVSYYEGYYLPGCETLGLCLLLVFLLVACLASYSTKVAMYCTVLYLFSIQYIHL